MTTASAPSPAGTIGRAVTGFILSRALSVAARLGIADRIDSEPVPIERLAADVDADTDSLYRVMRTLAGAGIFVETPDREFGHSDASALLRRDAGTFAEFAVVFGEPFYDAFGRLDHTVRTGEPAFDLVHGTDYDDHFARRPDLGSRYHAFMAGGKEALAATLADRDWHDGELVVDVGGGNGALLAGLLRRRTTLRGVVTDLPHVVAEARDRIEREGLGDRMRAEGGSFLDGVPAGGDTYVLSRILHGWSDAAAGDILGHVRSEIRPDGRLLLVNSVVAPPNEPGEKTMDLLAMVLGGRERTESEWSGLLHGAGFELAGVEPGRLHGVLTARPR